VVAKCAWVPEFSDEGAETDGKLGGYVGEWMEKEEVPERTDMRESLNNNVEVVIGFDVVHANESRTVSLVRQIDRLFCIFVQPLDVWFCKLRINDILDIFQTLVVDFVSFRQNVDPLRLHVDEDMVTDFQSMKVGV